MRKPAARAKTSFDYPLVINRLRAPGCTGSLGLTFCPGKKAPIVDGGVPDRQFERAWHSAGPEIYGLLQGGSNVVLHCRGGLGRTALPCFA